MSFFDSITDLITRVSRKNIDDYGVIGLNEIKNVPFHEGISAAFTKGSFSYYYCLPNHPFAQFCVRLHITIHGRQPTYTDLSVDLSDSDDLCYFFRRNEHIANDYYIGSEYENETDINSTIPLYNRNYVRNESTTFSTTYELDKPDAIIIPHAETLNLYELRSSYLGNEFNLTKIVNEKILCKAEGYNHLESYVQTVDSTRMQTEVLNMRLKLELLSEIMDKGLCTDIQIQKKYKTLCDEPK